MWSVFLEYWHWFLYYTRLAHLPLSRFKYLIKFIKVILFDKQVPDNHFDKFLSCKQFQLEVCLFLTKERIWFLDVFSYVNVLHKWLKQDKANYTTKNCLLLDIILSDLAEAETHTLTDGFLTPMELLKTKYLRDIWRSNNN